MREEWEQHTWQRSQIWGNGVLIVQRQRRPGLWEALVFAGHMSWRELRCRMACLALLPTNSTLNTRSCAEV